MRKLHLWLGGLAAVALAIAYLYYFQLIPVVSAATGFVAKTYCSARYVSGRTPLSILAEELALPEVQWVVVREDPQRYLVTARLSFSGVYGSGDYTRSDFASTAVYRPGLGCTLATGTAVGELSAYRADSPNIRAIQPFRHPVSDLPTRLHSDAAAYVRKQFERDVGTRALLVWHQSALVAEQYGPGIQSTMPQIGWSMGKSVLHALIGSAVQQGLLSVDDTNLRPQWASDSRSAISIDNLLRMNSGLRFDETYELGHDVTSMLFNSHSAATYAERQPQDHTPGSHWQYSSGTSNILAAVLGDRVRGETDLSAAQFAHQHLFDQLKAPSFILEPDASGQLLASSFAWATARDWLRFGILYLYDGEFLGNRIFPEGWAAYAASPTADSSGKYGAHFWINSPAQPGGERPMPALPEDTYYAGGFNGQNVVIIPSRDLIVVRLGLTPAPADWDLNEHLPALLQALAEKSMPEKSMPAK